MSQKISAKNLQYNTTLPPFLARLRGENPSGADRDGPDPILAGRRRAVKPRSGSAEAEDAPLVVDDQGNAVDVTVGADGSVKEKESAEKPQDASPGEGTLATEASAKVGEKLADIGGQRKKRKIGKIIGAETEEDDPEDKHGKSDKSSRPKAGNALAAEKEDPTVVAKPKPKKKAKKVKLSFGDDEG
ncbi:hypothetical protein CHGG_05363 [Chaetomium globosum CBS 148.51]|uniref:DUF4604 domain-containing protein n=1 Tax=Chaetomium globosum (strain ATCC 6205 / CBS 148.51 / DSM 1962 / NBRC 6347 / NRRL 1970) TaxID=306901 RepID=Q2H7K2_CHAGB|nr:uncharacterized protein CHGG_05363 [Chaetomium globosum CBS 148.51]EAQ88744.1 hypothetical protein CHGG_05363 [Chaetomium globosum CBS 148.51]